MSDSSPRRRLPSPIAARTHHAYSRPRVFSPRVFRIPPPPFDKPSVRSTSPSSTSHPSLYGNGHPTRWPFPYTRILLKKHAECGMRAPFPGQLERIVPFLACKTPGRKVCGLGFLFRTFHQGRSHATFEARFEQKRERSYSPKRFSSSSLMIFNAFTRA